jgi:dipeptidyl aminopeptidase/acylaminoacyl peptidase
MMSVVLAIGVVLSGCRIATETVSSPSAAASIRVVPSPSASASELEAPLGGGLILATAFVPKDQSLDVFTLDPGSGQQMLLGTLPWISPSSISRNDYTFQWGQDRRHVVITGYAESLDNQTDAAREFTFICCDRWVLSPRSDQLAAMHQGSIHVPGQEGTFEIEDGVVIRDVDGGDPRLLPLPPDAQAVGLSWSPDGSAVVVSGCRPCNNNPNNPLYPDWTPTAVQHSHLFIVPVDGSPVRELLDDTRAVFVSATWSPDGATIALTRSECPPDKNPPWCYGGTNFSNTNVLVSLDVAGGRQTDLAEVLAAPVWSPDGARIAFNDESDERGLFVMDSNGSHLAKVADGWLRGWSPDGEWLLFAAPNGCCELWIVRADGGEPRLLGTFGGAAW